MLNLGGTNPVQHRFHCLGEPNSLLTWTRADQRTVRFSIVEDNDTTEIQGRLYKNLSLDLGSSLSISRENDTGVYICTNTVTSESALVNITGGKIFETIGRDIARVTTTIANMNYT